jgi:hypothetical protein
MIHAETGRDHGRLVLIGTPRPEPIDFLNADDVGIVRARRA